MAGDKWKGAGIAICRCLLYLVLYFAAMHIRAKIAALEPEDLSEFLWRSCFRWSLVSPNYHDHDQPDKF